MMKTKILSLAFVSLGIMCSQAVTTINWDFGTLNVANSGVIADGRAVYLFVNTSGAVQDLAAMNTSLKGLNLVQGSTFGTDLVILGTATVNSASYGIPGSGNAAAVNIPYTNGVSLGDALGMIWFDQTPGAIGSSIKWGLWQSGDVTMPADGGNITISFLDQTNGGSAPNGLITTNITTAAIPEPSAALLGAIGALGLLRRRRN